MIPTSTIFSENHSCEGGLQEDQRRSAADGDEGGGRSQLDVDQAGDAMQPVKIQPCLERPALPEQKGQRDQSARPERDRGKMHEFQKGRHSAGSLDRRLDHAIQSPDTEIRQHRRHPHQQAGKLLVSERRESPSCRAREMHGIERPGREHDQRAEKAHLPNRRYECDQRRAGLRAAPGSPATTARRFQAAKSASANRQARWRGPRHRAPARAIARG